MNIDTAIEKLNAFKKIAKKMSSECELVGFDDKSITLQVKFPEEAAKHKPIIGFNVQDA